MATLTVNCGSFNKTSKSGNTTYGSSVNFSIPAGATITGCSVSFTTQGSSGQTSDRAFSINGTRAHSSGSWAQAGALHAYLLYPGNNTFRVTLKSKTGTLSSPGECWWSISGITLTITYTVGGGGDPGGDPGGGEDPPPPLPPYIGNLNVSPTSITAGASLYIATGACDGGLIRDISIYRTDTNAFVASVVAGYGIEAGQWLFPIPVAWCAFAPHETQFQIRIELYAHYPDGGYGGVENKIVTVYVPDNIKPTIGSLTAAYNANGVNGAITKYVQNYSKVNLAMGNVAGIYGSSIIAYQITGGGLSAWSSSATLGPFAQSGNITFTAKVVDSRGRVGTKTVAINVEPYSPPAFSIPEAWRSNYDGVKNQKGTYVRLKSGVSFSSIGGQNAVTLKGRVYIKGGTAPAWSSMTPGQALILGGGALLFTRTYIAQIQVSDLLGSRIAEFVIPTKKTGLSIMAGVSGAAIGKSAETPGILDVAWPIVAPGLAPNPNILHNWDFRNPVNQRGATGTISTTGYFYDRWKLSMGTVHLNSGYIVLNGYMSQLSEHDLTGKVVTFSCLTSSGIIYSKTVTVPTTQIYDFPGINELNISGSQVGFYNYASTLTQIAAVKLELGPVSTLHLDPPVDHAVELPKCRRYYVEFDTISKAPYTISGNEVNFYYEYPVPMRRVSASISVVSGAVVSQPFEVQSGFTFAGYGDADGTRFYVIATKASHGLSSWTCYGGFKIKASSDL